MTPRSMVFANARSHYPELSDAQIEAAINGWELLPFMDGGILMGTFLVKGFELHFCPAPGFKLNRVTLRDALAQQLEKHGFLTTRVLLTDKENQRFNKIFGFSPTWSDGQFQYFILTGDQPGERQSCQ